MSVIYKTLKRLKSQSEGHQEMAALPGAVTHQERHAKRFILPISICVLGIVMVLSGVGFIYGIEWIAEIGGGQRTDGPVILRKGIYARPDVQDIAESNPVDLRPTQPGDFVESPSVRQPPLASYQAPEKVSKSDDKASDVVVALQEPSSAAAPAINDLKTDIPEHKQPPTELIKPVAVKKAYASFDAEAMAEAPVKQPLHDVAAESDTQSTDAIKCLEINRLVAKIKKDMALGREDNIEALLKELEVYKGKSSPFVLKLRAYWHMRRSEDNMAMELLQKVLRENNEDFEAGVNMAILEIRNRQYRDAHGRLAQLREIYPEENMVNDLLQKLKGHLKNG